MQLALYDPQAVCAAVSPCSNFNLISSALTRPLAMSPVQSVAPVFSCPNITAVSPARQAKSPPKPLSQLFKRPFQIHFYPTTLYRSSRKAGITIIPPSLCAMRSARCAMHSAPAFRLHLAHPKNPHHPPLETSLFLFVLPQKVTKKASKNKAVPLPASPRPQFLQASAPFYRCALHEIIPARPPIFSSNKSQSFLFIKTD